MIDVITWVVGLVFAAIIAAALVYILGFIASMLVSMGYGLFQGVEHAAQRVHVPHFHMPHRHGHAAG